MAALVQGFSRIELDGSTKKRSQDDAPLCRTPVIKRNEVAWRWYESIGAPKLFVAPLVGYSEPAFRLLCRRDIETSSPSRAGAKIDRSRRSSAARSCAAV